MAADETEVANLALSLLGEARIDDIDSGTDKVSVECRLGFATVRQALLREHPWNFAGKRIAVDADATAPAFEWLYRYALPSDFIAVRDINGRPPTATVRDWELEGAWILTDSTTCNLRYTFDQIDPSAWDSLFLEVFCLRLAARVANAVTGSRTTGAEMLQLADSKFGPTAKKKDAQEGREPRVLDWTESDAIRARFQGDLAVPRLPDP